MRKTFIFVFMASCIAMASFTSCSKDDDEINYTEGTDYRHSKFEEYAKGIILKSAWVEDSYLHLSTKEENGKSSGTECEISFMCKLANRHGIRPDTDDDAVDLVVKYRSGNSRITLKGNYPYGYEDGTISITTKSKKEGIYHIWLFINEVKDESTNALAKNISFEFDSKIELRE
ncbi:MAG: hypothetical protein J5735_06285 [Prevotella sp.]|nr:hypothetical protein [Prevotella sp.]